MERIFVDTGVWYALANARDVNHEQAVQLVNGSHRLITTNYVLDETITLSRMRMGHHQALTIGELLWSEDLAEIIRISEEDELEAWRLFKQFDDKRFSFTDCTSFAVMLRLKIFTVFTFDEDFARTGLFICIP